MTAGVRGGVEGQVGRVAEAVRFRGTARKRNRARNPIRLPLFEKSELLLYKISVFVYLERFSSVLPDPVRRDQFGAPIYDFRL